MLNLDPSKLLVIAVVIVIVLGPNRLPHFARQVGGAWRSFSEFRQRMESEVRASMPDLPSTTRNWLIMHGRLRPYSTISPLPLQPMTLRRTAFAPWVIFPPSLRAIKRTGAQIPLQTRRLLERQAPTPRRCGSRRTRPCGRRHVELSDAMALPVDPRSPKQAFPEAMTVGEHFGELRYRLIVSVSAFAAMAIVAVFTYEPILHLFSRSAHSAASTPASGIMWRPRPGRWWGTTGAAATSTSPRRSMGCRCGSRVRCSGAWSSHRPSCFSRCGDSSPLASRARERRYAVPFVSASFVLFILGALTAYVTLPHALGFLRSVGGPNLQAIYDPIPYLGLIILMMTLFGLTFQFPVVLVSLELARVVTSRQALAVLALGRDRHHGGGGRGHPRAQIRSPCWPSRCRWLPSISCRSGLAKCWADRQLWNVVSQWKCVLGQAVASGAVWLDFQP